jgi:hypothetical protein
MLEKCRIIELPKIMDYRGNLTFVEKMKHVPFEISRVYYLYDVPGGESRAGHGHKELQQLIIAASGSFDVILDDGYQRKTFTLNRPNYGLYVCSMIWRELENFSSGAVSLVLASTLYDENDYYRNYEEFLQVVRKYHPRENGDPSCPSS